jgi:hypothetical protein
MATKTLSIRINDDDFKFLSSLAKEERRGMSTAVRELVDFGRILLAVASSGARGNTSLALFAANPSQETHDPFLFSAPPFTAFSLPFLRAQER